MAQVIIRAAQAGDGAACAAIYAPYVRDTVITFELEPPSAEEMTQRILAAQARHAWLVLEEGGALLGYAHAGAHSPRAAYARTANLGIYMAMEARGRGLGPQLYGALIEALAHKGFHSLLACIAQPNASSVALHEKLGFVKVGYFREMGWKQDGWRDVGWWQKLL